MYQILGGIHRGKWIDDACIGGQRGWNGYILTFQKVDVDAFWFRTLCEDGFTQDKSAVCNYAHPFHVVKADTCELFACELSTCCANKEPCPSRCCHTHGVNTSLAYPAASDKKTTVNFLHCLWLDGEVGDAGCSCAQWVGLVA